MTLKVIPRWSRRIEAINAELMHLSAACDVTLDDSATIERIIRNDDTVCGRKNEIGFRKLRIVVVVTYVLLIEYIERVGPAETRRIAASLAEHMYILQSARAPAMKRTPGLDRGYTGIHSQVEQAARG